MIRRTRYDYQRERRVSTDLRVAMARASALANSAWVQARRNNDYASFKPRLAEILDLKRAYADAFREPEQSRYDALVDDFEHGITTIEIAEIFSAVRDGIAPLLTRITANADKVDGAALQGDFPAEQQAALCRATLEPLGFHPGAWRLDPTVHPFASNSATQDIRITTRYEPHILGPAFFGSLHEFGHGLYEHQVDPALERTPLCRGTSLGWHESQSRMWENLVGRSRAFTHWVHPRLKRVFRKHFARYDAEAFYRAANRVQPSFIRIEAVLHSYRGRRGDLYAAHRHPLRARTGADRGSAQRRRPAAGLERQDAPLSGGRGAQRLARRAARRALVGRLLRLLPDL